jgi:hypothetical protein
VWKPQVDARIFRMEKRFAALDGAASLDAAVHEDVGVSIIAELMESTASCQCWRSAWRVLCFVCSVECDEIG